MKRLLSVFDASLGVLLGALIAVIAVLIFVNVVLRYAFDSGLTWAEEVTRFLFVWTVFLGAVAALREQNHLGFTAVVKAMPVAIKKSFFLISNLLMLGVLGLLLVGAFELVPIGMMNVGAATGIPMAVMYSVVVPMSLLMMLIIGSNVYTALMVPGSVDRLIDLKESEEEAQFK